MSAKEQMTCLAALAAVQRLLQDGRLSPESVDSLVQGAVAGAS